MTFLKHDKLFFYTFYAYAKKYLLIFVFIGFFVSCNYQAEKENKATLNEVAQVLEGNPKQALNLLQTIKIGLLSEYDYAYYTLLQTRAWNMVGIDIAASDTVVIKAKNYFVNKQDAEKAAFACFVIGRVYEMQEKLAKAIYNYHCADEWAGKINNIIPNFSYSIIPYNIASLYYDQKNYSESLRYVEKSIEYIKSERGSYKDMMYALELKALNYQYIDKTREALGNYDEALKIAEQNNDAYSKTRILYNKCVLYFDINDYDYVDAERNCNQSIDLIAHSGDSTDIGILYTVKAYIYACTNRVDSALIIAYEAKDLMINAPNNSLMILYRTLYEIETIKGNVEKVKQYKQLRDYYKKTYENQSALSHADLQSELKKQQEEKISEVLLLAKNSRQVVQKQLQNNRIISTLIVVCLMATTFLYYKYKAVRRKSAKEIKEQIDVAKLQIQELAEQEMMTTAKQINEELREYRIEQEEMRKSARAELIKSILQRRDLTLLLDCLEDNEQNTRAKSSKLISLVENMLNKTHWNEMYPLLKINYGDLFSDLRRDFPMFDEMEHRVCSLICTQLFDVQEMADLLQLSLDDFKAVKRSIARKLDKAGYNLFYLENYAKKHIDRKLNKPRLASEKNSN